MEDVSGNDTDPPHVDAKKAYASMVGNDNVLLTSDYAAGSGSDPLTIEVGDGVCGQVTRRRAGEARAPRSWRSGSGWRLPRSPGRSPPDVWRRGARGRARATSRSHDRVSPFVEMTSREEFIADIGARGFVPAGDDEWRGPVRVPDEEGHERQIEHEVWLPQDFPFTGPKVRPVDPLPGPQWHMEHTGHLCLYPTDPGSLPDWDDAQALLERVAGWYVDTSGGRATQGTSTSTGTSPAKTRASSSYTRAL